MRVTAVDRRVSTDLRGGDRDSDAAADLVARIGASSGGEGPGSVFIGSGPAQAGPGGAADIDLAEAWHIGQGQGAFRSELMVRFDVDEPAAYRLSGSFTNSRSAHDGVLLRVTGPAGGAAVIDEGLDYAGEGVECGDDFCSPVNAAASVGRVGRLAPGSYVLELDVTGGPFGTASSNAGENRFSLDFDAAPPPAAVPLPPAAWAGFATLGAAAAAASRCKGARNPPRSGRRRPGAAHPPRQ